MSETLLSVGIDLGTTTMQMIVSELVIVNTASMFSVPNMEIGNRTVIYKSIPVLTPLLSNTVLDVKSIHRILIEEYAKAGISPEQIQTGAVIITGETARKENAQEVLRSLSDLAGKFVVAAAGPALESVLAARGAGADRYAKEHGVYVLNLDIGGGTTNLALYDPDGELMDTGCINVGGRLIKCSDQAIVTYISPVLKQFTTLEVGEKVTPERMKPIVDLLVDALEQATGLKPQTNLLQSLVTDKLICYFPAPLVISFSGGVAELMAQTEADWLKYGDIGLLLANAISGSSLCKSTYVLGKERVRATVIGAGCYTTELSGSTVEYTHLSFPMENIPAVCVDGPLESSDVKNRVKQKMKVFPSEPVALGLEGIVSPTYEEVDRCAACLLDLLQDRPEPVVLVVHCDMGKALGQALRSKLGNEKTMICLDGISLKDGSFLDILEPIGRGTAVPVVVKTLAFDH